jgi:hypothetical protein
MAHVLLSMLQIFLVRMMLEITWKQLSKMKYTCWTHLLVNSPWTLFSETIRYEKQTSVQISLRDLTLVQITLDRVCTQVAAVASVPSRADLLLFLLDPLHQEYLCQPPHWCGLHHLHLVRIL